MIVVHYWPKPIPSRDFDYLALDEATYDGATDGDNLIGHGCSPGAAIQDLLDAMEAA